GCALSADGTEVVPYQRQEAVLLPPVEPDDGREVLHLLWGEVVDRARDLAIDLTRVKHQHLVFALSGLGAVEEPQLAGDGTRVEEIGADGDDYVHVTSLDNLLTHLLLAVPGARGLRRHDEAGAALVIPIAPEVGDPQIVAVTDVLVLVHPRQGKG